MWCFLSLCSCKLLKTVVDMADPCHSANILLENLQTLFLWYRLLLLLAGVAAIFGGLYAIVVNTNFLSDAGSCLRCVSSSRREMCATELQLAQVSKLLPDSGGTVAHLLKEEQYYCLLIPLTVPVTSIVV